MQTVRLEAREVEKVLSLEEGHFIDFKAQEIAPAKLTRTLSAFANADGGSVYVGIAHDKATGRSHWQGFANVEAANGHIQVLEQFFPLGNHVSYQFLRSPNDRSLVLQIEISKTPNVRTASDGVAYLRRGAQNLPQKSPRTALSA